MKNTNVLQVGIDTLEPNPWNPNEMTEAMMAKARASIRNFGFIDPILVRSIPRSDVQQIIDGEQRWNAARAEGLKSVLVRDLGIVPDHVAKRLTIVLNETRGKFDRVGLAKLVDEILSTGDAEVAAVAREVLPYTERELESFRKIASFDWDQPDQVRPPQSPEEPVTIAKSIALKIRATDSQIGAIQATLATMTAELGITDADALERLAARYLEDSEVT